MRVLIACEYSGIVREAFKARGHDAWSCDLLPTEIPGQHIQGDVLELLRSEWRGVAWDMMIAHPPCTHLTTAGAIFFTSKQRNEPALPGINLMSVQDEALSFVKILMEIPIPKICIENPVGIISTQIRKPDQIINPFQFGEPIPKKTCLWLKGLPKLKPTNIVSPEYIIYKSKSKKQGFSRYSKLLSETRCGKNRSKFFPGIAKAMAEQWG